MLRRVDVLDKGYVRLTRIMAEIGEDGSLTPVSDLAPANDAKVSFAREAEEFTEKEERLVRFLGREGHTSPFRGAILQFEVKAPLFVRNQIHKYMIGSDHEALRDPFHQWNEVSRRYVEEDLEFYIPSEWRSAPANRKQGSGDAVAATISTWAKLQLDDVIDYGTHCYHEALGDGICAEQARLFLPAYALYTTWRWTLSLQAFFHVLNERIPHDAQWETRQYALAMQQIGTPLFPVAAEAMLKESA